MIVEWRRDSRELLADMLDTNAHPPHPREVKYIPHLTEEYAMSPTRRDRGLILSLLLMAVCTVSAAPPKPADSKPIAQADIERLIRRLGSDSFADREEAMKELRRLGKPALEALRTAAATNRDKEIRRRAAELVDKLLEPPYKKLYGEGMRLLEKKEYRKAAASLKQAAKLYENDATIPRALKDGTVSRSSPRFICLWPAPFEGWKSTPRPPAPMGARLIITEMENARKLTAKCWR